MFNFTITKAAADCKKILEFQENPFHKIILDMRALKVPSWIQRSVKVEVHFFFIKLKTLGMP